MRAAVLHVSHGRRSEARSFGLAKATDTVFLLASITKPMTATCVMMMADRGLLSLDDPVVRHIPSATWGPRELCAGMIRIKTDVCLADDEAAGPVADQAAATRG